MASHRNELTRKEILLQLYGLRPMARSAEQMERECKRRGDDFTKQEIATELQFLHDEGLIFEIPASGSGSTSRLYRIHSSGVRHYEQNYAA